MKAKRKVNKQPGTNRKKESKALLAQKVELHKNKLLTLSAQQLIHELEVYQVELELQNDELTISQILLEKEKTRFSGLFDLSPVAYFVLNRNAIILECNDTAALMFRIHKKALIGRPFNLYVFGEYKDIFYSYVSKIINNNRQYSCEVKFHTLDQNFFYGRVEGKLVADGEMDCFYFAVSDITEKRLAELKHRETESQLQMALSSSYTGTWNVDLEMKRVQLNPHAIAILGFEFTNTHNSFESFLKVIYKDDLPVVESAFREAIESNSELHITFRIHHPDKATRHVEARGHMSKPGFEKTFLSGIITDITEKVKLETIALKLKTEQQLNIIRAIVETGETERTRISEALHDSIAQTLYAIGLNLDNCKTKEPSYQKAYTLVQQAINQTRNISFELAPAVLTDFGLPAALKEMLNRINSKQLKFLLRLSGFSKRMTNNAEIFIFRIVQELSNNVIKHSKAHKGGITLNRKKSTVIIKIMDDGIGFDTNERTASSSGLYSIKNRIALYNGEMSLVSKKNIGTTVTVKLYEVT